jgi:hypothetical protein
MRFSPSKLFHTVVITGAALTGCATATQKPQTPADPGNAAGAAKTCPPGSERPYPPCYWIR